MREILSLVMLSFAAGAAADDLDRAIALFKDGAVVRAIGVVSTLTQSEDAAVFHADMLLRVFDKAERAIVVARATHGHPDEKLKLAEFDLSAADREIVDGRLLGQDHARAFELFRELADAGDPRGMFWVGGLLLREDASQYDGIPVDLPTGWAYLNAAASFGYGPAIDSLRNVPERLRHFGATDRPPPRDRDKLKTRMTTPRFHDEVIGCWNAPTICSGSARQRPDRR
ncbi:MAG: hypothetical protein OXH15_05950 [Gammaproteobacteria bacterium]|nr:hypothetical protein [Gammaproteobacteria bacterium]